jgi:hypothetical protein
VIYVRLRRALRRHIASLVIEGTIERLEVGPRAIRCLRLTQYNPDYRPDSKPLIEPGPSRQVVSQRTAEGALRGHCYAKPTDSEQSTPLRSIRSAACRW